MKTKRRLLMPVLICLVLISSLAFGIWQWYDANVDRSGWVEKDGVVFYRDFHAQSVSGWLEVEGRTYYFQEGGIPVTGWQTLEGSTYYFGQAGAMKTGWQDIEGDTYFFTSEGVMHSGWLETQEGTYYLPQGKRASGWQTVGGKTYYFTGGGQMARGFASIDGQRYYLGEDGVMVTGELVIREQRYFFREDGAMHTGWLDTGEGRRYYLPDGTMAVGWQTLSNQHYFFREDGSVYTGWLRDGEYSYYLQEDGAAAVGPVKIDGTTHYFTPRGIEVILVNGKNSVPEDYKPELKTLVDWHQVDARCYDALVRMLRDCQNAGIEYTFNSGYRTIQTQKEILDARTREHMENYDLEFKEAREKALRTVAVPGTSEHHLGLAVDLLGAEAQVWLRENCWNYGFILRYLEGKEGYTGITDEPWHFRYVGTRVSLDMKDTGLSLEEYLGAEPVKPWLNP